MSSTELHLVLDELEGCLLALREEGVTELPVSPIPLPVPELSEETGDGDDPIVEQTAEGPQLLALKRMEACGDPEAARDLRVALLLLAGELEGDAANLLHDMLHAIGMEVDGSLRPLPASEELGEGFALCIAMGQAALEAVQSLPMGLELLRGKVIPSDAGPCIPTFPPSYLATTPAAKRATWQDLQLALRTLGLEVPAWTREKLQKKKG